MIIKIKLDIFCSNSSGNEPIYRVYVDSDLLTERSWIWPAYDTYICENIEVDVEPGEHKIRIEKISKSVKFTAKNLIVNAQPIQILNQQNIVFTI